MEDRNFTVSVTQCSTCGTLSVHWGRELDDACELCSETAILINNFLDPQFPMEVEHFPMDSLGNLDPDSQRGLRQDEMDYYSGNGEFTGGLNDLLNALDQTAERSKSTLSYIESIANRELDELNDMVPLLNSVRRSVAANWISLQMALADVNVFLETPEDHWRWERKLEIHRDNVMVPLNNLNSYIGECKDIGIDIVDCSEPLFCALAKLPEYYFIGKEDIEDRHALFYYDATADAFNSYGTIDSNHAYRSLIDRD